MNYQWRGFLAVCGLVGAIMSYNYVRLQGKVDELERNFEVYQLQMSVDMANLKSTCEHVSAPRMLTIDIRDAQQTQDIKDIKQKLKMR